MKEYEDWQEWLKETRADLVGSDDFLEAAYRQIYEQDRHATIVRELAERCDNPLEALDRYILVHGLYPPPELLLIISKFYGSYRDNPGRNSLEELFFNGDKGFAKAKKKKKESDQILWRFALMAGARNNYSLSEVAAKFVADGFYHGEVSSLKKRHDRDEVSKAHWKELKKEAAEKKDN
jgi:hypothetical protein